MSWAKYQNEVNEYSDKPHFVCLSIPPHGTITGCQYNIGLLGKGSKLCIVKLYYHLLTGSQAESSKMKIFIFLKISFTLSLFTTFLLFFGVPSLKKYLAKEVFINKKKISIHDIAPPAVTFCAFHKGSPWKPENYSEYESFSEKEHDMEIEYKEDDDEDPDSLSYILSKCGQYETAEDVFDCINAKTFNFTETVPFATSEIGPHNKTELTNSSFWIQDITLIILGKCHTLNNSVALGSAKWWFMFDPSIDMKIFIHDPHFFLMTANPATIPTVLMDLRNHHGLQFMYLEVVQHVNMNRPNQPCQEALEYSFTACVRNSVSDKVGCRLGHNLSKLPN